MSFSKLYALMKYAKGYGHTQLKKIGVSDTEHLICAFVFGHSHSSQDDVAEALKLDKTTVAKALLTLEKKGYIERIPNPENRRKNIIYITELGKENISDVASIYDAWLDRISKVLEPQEWKQFEDYCERLLEMAEKVNREVD